MKNWKTTLIGLLAAIWMVLQPIIAKGDFELSRDWKQLIYAGILASFGYFTKDHDSSTLNAASKN